MVKEFEIQFYIFFNRPVEEKARQKLFSLK
jgi:hypothetical protein